MRRIVCVGNRYVPEDAAGPAVYDLLAEGPLPADVELVDGGLRGLDLLRAFDGAERVVCVDRILGSSSAEPVVVLSAEEAAMKCRPFGHAAGLPYLLRALPWVAEGPLPDVRVVAVADPSPEGLREAARISLLLATGGRPKDTVSSIGDGEADGQS